MTEFKVRSGFIETVSLLEQTVGPRKYWLHNRVGSTNWEVTTSGGETIIKLDDAKMLTYLLLKLK